jgi:hypothetical protein
MSGIESKISTRAPLQYGTNYSSLIRGSNVTEAFQNLALVLGTAGGQTARCQSIIARVQMPLKSLGQLTPPISIQIIFTTKEVALQPH